MVDLTFLILSGLAELILVASDSDYIRDSERTTTKVFRAIAIGLLASLIGLSAYVLLDI